MGCVPVVRPGASSSVPRQSWTFHFCFATVTGAENDGGSAVAVLLGVVQFLDKIVAVPVGATTGGRATLRSTVDTCWLLEEFHEFLREGVDWAPEVDSRPTLPRTSSTTAVACFARVFLVFTHLAPCSPIVSRLGDRSLPFVVWRSMHSRCFGRRAVFPRKSGQFSL